ncbi:MAG: 3'(2'),5'-bisphosphate nucleotidase CysQ family protein [Alphaproteobacteria bacterium]
MKNLESIIIELKSVIKQAGSLAMEIYNTDFDVDYKDDNSPVTIADKKCEGLIIDAISILTPDIPIYGEETFDKNTIIADKFWLIDPIDGTKSFVKKDNLFTVNIGLVENNKPVLGLVYEPQNDELYVGSTLGVFKNDVPISVKKMQDEIIIASNGQLEKLEKFQTLLGDLKVKDYLKLTSSIKICRVAEGVADLYPRFGYTSEWDTAAAHAILKYAGGNIITYDKSELSYGKENLLNHKFIYVYGDKNSVKLLDNIKEQA